MPGLDHIAGDGGHRRVFVLTDSLVPGLLDENLKSEKETLRQVESLALGGVVTAWIFFLWRPSLADAAERRLAVVRLHSEGWGVTSIAGYLGIDWGKDNRNALRNGWITMPSMTEQPAVGDANGRFIRPGVDGRGDGGP